MNIILKSPHKSFYKVWYITFDMEDDMCYFWTMFGKQNCLISNILKIENNQ